MAVLGACAVLTQAGAGPAWSVASKTPAARQVVKLAVKTCDPLTTFKRNKFEKSAKIDNKWLPLTPGTRFTLEGQSDTGTGLVPHKVILIVTDLTKKINGVTTRVLWDRDIIDNELVESELAFHAQDKKKNVWNLGEYPEEFEGGVFQNADNTWIAGEDRAKAGVLVPGRPREGEPKFLQGFAPEIDFLDCGKVIDDDRKVCVPGKCYRGVLVIDETSPPDPAIQTKFYAPGVGNIKIKAAEENLLLTSKVKLDDRDRRRANRAALKLERHAYKICVDPEPCGVYQDTEPMEFDTFGRS